MSRVAWHRTLVTIVVVMLALAAGFYVTSVVLAQDHGRDVAGLFDGWAMFALLGAIGFGIADFFVRPLGGRSGEPEVRAAAQDDRIRAASVRERAGR